VENGTVTAKVKYRLMFDSIWFRLIWTPVLKVVPSFCPESRLFENKGEPAHGRAENMPGVGKALDN